MLKKILVLLVIKNYFGLKFSICYVFIYTFYLLLL